MWVCVVGREKFFDLDILYLPTGIYVCSLPCCEPLRYLKAQNPKAFLVLTLDELARGVHTPESTSIRIYEGEALAKAG